MNVADSQRVASSLEHLGYQMTRQAEEADVIVLNTCVVRQSAEDKAYGRLNSLRPLKEQNPGLIINLMGCLVGVKGHERLQKRFPFVDGEIVWHQDLYCSHGLLLSWVWRLERCRT